MTLQSSLQRGLVGHWIIDSTDVSGGTAYDRTAYNNHGSSNSITKTTGIWGDAYDFTNSSGIVVDNDESLQVIGDLTIAFWIYPTNISGERQNPIHKDYTHEYTMTLETDGALSFYFNDSDSNYNNYQVADMFQSDNEWVHVVAVRDTGTEVRWYRNGSLFATKGWNGGDPIEGGNSVSIGDGYTNALNGKMKDVRIYNRTLTEEEVRALYNMRSERVAQV